MLTIDGADFTDIVENVKYTSPWNNGPGTLAFSYPQKKASLYPRGSVVTLTYGGANIFYGWLFKATQSRDKISCTCYDQLRYLRASDTLMRQQEPLDVFLNRACATFSERIRLGQVDSTEYNLPKYNFDNKTYLDMLYQSIQDNLTGNSYLYTLRDNFGALDLRDTVDLRLPLILGDASLATDFEYTVSIDDDTFNCVRVAKDNKQTGVREVYEAVDSANIAKWGKLAIYDKVSADLNPAQLVQRANLLLAIKNRETETLSIEAVGDTRVMGGSGLLVIIRDAGLNTWAVVGNAVHEFGKVHTMKLDLIFGRWY